LKKQRFALKPMPIGYAGGWIFAPQTTPARAGLIFYPGGSLRAAAA